jgi:hypothetical protein
MAITTVVLQAALFLFILLAVARPAAALAKEGGWR